MKKLLTLILSVILISFSQLSIASSTKVCIAKEKHWEVGKIMGGPDGPPKGKIAVEISKNPLIEVKKEKGTWVKGLLLNKNYLIKVYAGNQIYQSFRYKFEQSHPAKCLQFTGYQFPQIIDYYPDCGCD